MQHDQAERDLKVEEKQRLLGVMPQLGSDERPGGASDRRPKVENLPCTARSIRFILAGQS
jgi:hypothetical protein